MASRRQSEINYDDEEYIMTRNRRSTMEKALDAGSRKGSLGRRKARAVCRKSTPRSTMPHFSEDNHNRRSVINDFVETNDTTHPKPARATHATYSGSSGVGLKRKIEDVAQDHPRESEIDIPNWISHLIRLRRMKLENLGNGDIVLAKTTRTWLKDQYVALENETMPVTFKCILAASGLSKRFTAFRAEFTKPEYCSRYWVWSKSFISLIDFYIQNGHVKIPRNNFELQPIFQFVYQSLSKKKEGKLAPNRERLLKAVGISWEDYETSTENHEDVQPTENDGAHDIWNSTEGLDDEELSRRKMETKRIRREDYKEETCQETRYSKLLHSESNSLQSKAMREWGERLIEIRDHYQRGSYDIPSSKPQLTIWMNTEIAKVCTETQTPVYTGILKAAGLLTSISEVSVVKHHEVWGDSFIEFLDYSLDLKRGVRRSKKSQQLMDFMADCYYNYWYDSLSRERACLLRAVDTDWEQSNLMRVSLENCRDSGDRTVNLDSVPGRIVDYVLDAGDGYHFNKGKEKRSTAQCQEMVSSMIKGIVAETTQSRSKTTGEREAEQWVWQAGSSALNSYAKQWFQTANAEDV